VAKRSTENLNYLSDAISAWKREMEATADRVSGLQAISEETQLFRATLEKFMASGCSVHKISALRQFLTRRMGLTLVEPSLLVATYLPPIAMQEEKLVIDEHQGTWCGSYFDETTLTSWCGLRSSQWKAKADSISILARLVPRTTMADTCLFARQPRSQLTSMQRICTSHEPTEVTASRVLPAPSIPLPTTPLSRSSTRTPTSIFVGSTGITTPVPSPTPPSPRTTSWPGGMCAIISTVHGAL